MVEFGLISVIMAAYNAEKTIEQAIRSVLEQTYRNLEVIVINDASSDRTAEFVEEIAADDNRVKLITNEMNCGASVSRHRGVAEARGEWLAILDSDDEWMREKLEKQIALQKMTQAELLFTGSAFMDSDGSRKKWTLSVPSEICYRRLLKQNLISNSSVLVKTDLYRQHEILGDNMHEDFACWISILKTGRKAYGVNEPLIIYRLSKNSKSGNKLKAAKMNWNTYRAVNLSRVIAGYYMIWYAINGFLKYRKLYT